MILLPLISLGILIICLIGVLISFQYFTHYQSLMRMDRVHIADQRQRAQTALGYLVVFCCAALIALLGIIYPALIGFTPQPLPPAVTDPNPSTLSPDGTPELESDPGNIPTETSAPLPEVTPTRILQFATINNTGGAGANVRSIPGLAGVIIEVLDEGTRVIMLDERQEVDGFDWQKIEMPDTRDGWVVRQFLTPEN